MLDEDPTFSAILLEMIRTGSIDWHHFVNLCSNHLILPVIYLKFKSHNILSQLPEELSAFLKEIYDLNVIRNNKIIQQLHEVTELLNQNDIFPIYLKGAGNLLDELYERPGERIMSDIDFLVTETDYLRTANLLENNGYQMIDPFYGDLGKFRHYSQLAKSGQPAALEIHRIPSEIGKKWFNRQSIDKEKKASPTLNGCYVLSDQDKTILNFIHCQLVHQGHLYGTVSFRDLYDLYLLSKRVDLTQTITHIKLKQKAVAYFAFASKALGLNERFYTGSNFSYWLLSKKHYLNISSLTFYKIHKATVYISYRIYKGYIGVIIKSFYSKKIRQSIIKRLSSRQWYKGHFKSYTSFFSPYKKN